MSYWFDAAILAFARDYYLHASEIEAKRVDIPCSGYTIEAIDMRVKRFNLTLMVLN